MRTKDLFKNDFLISKWIVCFSLDIYSSIEIIYFSILGKKPENWESIDEVIRQQIVTQNCNGAELKSKILKPSIQMAINGFY